MYGLVFSWELIKSCAFRHPMSHAYLKFPPVASRKSDVSKSVSRRLVHCKMFSMKQLIVAFLAVSIVRASTLYFESANKEQQHAVSENKEAIDEVATAVTSFLTKTNNSSLDASKRGAIKDRCVSVLDVELEAYAKELTMATNLTVSVQICCQCNRCQRRCPACGLSCCCKGDQGCTCTTCGQDGDSVMKTSEVSFESASAPTTELVSKAKSHLTQVITSFIEHELNTVLFCCVCHSCTYYCTACGYVNCCCTGYGCACIPCMPTGSQAVSVVDSVIDGLVSKDIHNFPEVKAIMIMVEKLVNDLVINSA